MCSNVTNTIIVENCDYKYDRKYIGSTSHIMINSLPLMIVILSNGIVLNDETNIANLSDLQRLGLGTLAGFYYVAETLAKITIYCRKKHWDDDDIKYVLNPDKLMKEATDCITTVLSTFLKYMTWPYLYLTLIIITRKLIFWIGKYKKPVPNQECSEYGQYILKLYTTHMNNNQEKWKSAILQKFYFCYKGIVDQAILDMNKMLRRSRFSYINIKLENYVNNVAMLHPFCKTYYNDLKEFGFTGRSSSLIQQVNEYADGVTKKGGKISIDDAEDEKSATKPSKISKNRFYKFVNNLNDDDLKYYYDYLNNKIDKLTNEDKETGNNNGNDNINNNGNDTGSDGINNNGNDFKKNKKRRGQKSKAGPLTRKC